MEGNACRPAEMVAAGFWQRGMALGIDSALLTALHCTFFLLLGQALSGISPASPLNALAAAGILVVLFFFTPILMILVYSVVLHACGGQTVGKIIMGIKLIATDGTPVTGGVAFLRLVAVILSLLPLGAGFFWAAISRKRTTWHDMVAGTIVIAAEQRS